MTYVITRLCRDCVDGTCVEACPIDCIVQHAPEAAPSDLPNQLFIDPDQCIHCHMCLPACPWEAIFTEADVPHAFKEDIALNAIAAERPHEFSVPTARLARPATPEAVEQNKLKWIKPGV
jgi:ferredoxin--NADP+ reductase